MAISQDIQNQFDRIPNQCVFVLKTNRNVRVMLNEDYKKTYRVYDVSIGVQADKRNFRKLENALKAAIEYCGLEK